MPALGVRGAVTKAAVPTLRAVIEYDGTEFCGMQYQPSARTVAGEVERAFSTLLEHPVKITTAGRTDTGVHATGQVISWKSERSFPFDRFALAANSILPSDIRVRTLEITQASFSARFSARERVYVYAVHASEQPSALLARYAYHLWRPLNLAAVETAARHLTGEHDFRSFCGMLPQSGPTVRTVHALHAERKGDIVRIEVRADGFLHRMVRTIVGTLLECATARRDAETIPEMLQARDRRAAGATAPAHGLYLAGVRYDDGFDSFREPPVTAAFS